MNSLLERNQVVHKLGTYCLSIYIYTNIGTKLFLSVSFSLSHHTHMSAGTIVVTLHGSHTSTHHRPTQVLTSNCSRDFQFFLPRCLLKEWPVSECLGHFGRHNSRLLLGFRGIGTALLHRLAISVATRPVFAQSSPSLYRGKIIRG